MTDTKIQIRVSSAEKELWQRESKSRGMSLTELIRGGVESVLTGSVMTDVPTVVPTRTKQELKSVEVKTLEKEGLVSKGWNGPMFKDSKLNKKVYE